jgi:hypothetical protein
MFIKEINLAVDLDKLKTDINQLLTVTTWEPLNQIGLKYRPAAVDPWADSLGSIYDRKNASDLALENNFTEWNPQTPEYTRSIIDQLAQTLNIGIGRVRFMLLKPKTGLTIHRDKEVRYHLAIDSNPDAYISISKFSKTTDEDLGSCGVNYHIPANGYWYLVDTRYRHHVYNGGNTDRIHLVVCGI